MSYEFHWLFFILFHSFVFLLFAPLNFKCSVSRSLILLSGWMCFPISLLSFSVQSLFFHLWDFFIDGLLFLWTFLCVVFLIYLFLCSCSLLNFKIILNSLTVLRSLFLYGQLLELYYCSLVSCLLFMILDSLCWYLNIWASNLLFLYCRFIFIETVPHRHCSCSGFQ